MFNKSTKPKDSYSDMHSQFTIEETAKNIMKEKRKQEADINNSPYGRAYSGIRYKEKIQGQKDLESTQNKYNKIEKNDNTIGEDLEKDKLYSVSFKTIMNDRYRKWFLGFINTNFLKYENFHRRLLKNIHTIKENTVNLNQENEKVEATKQVIYRVKKVRKNDENN